MYPLCISLFHPFPLEHVMSPHYAYITLLLVLPQGLHLRHLPNKIRIQPKMSSECARFVEIEHRINRYQKGKASFLGAECHWYVAHDIR
jgi:hypothetical protein